MHRVVIFSPSRYSLYTITVTELLRRKGIKIEAIIVRRLTNISRFESELKRDGRRLFWKIWRKLILKKKAYNQGESENITNMMNENGINYNNVDCFKKNNNIPVIYCKDLSDPKIEAELNRLKPDLVLFTGGGLIRQNILEKSGGGVLNCHMGLLPHYRGMDVVEWPILENNAAKIGLSVHLMDSGVDTGDILHVQKLTRRDGESIGKLRERFEPEMCSALVTTTLRYLDGEIKKTPQKTTDGKQYFIMHPRLLELTALKTIDT